MDKLKSFMGSSSEQKPAEGSSSAQGQNQGGQNPSGQKEDFVDKGIDAVGKKFGFSTTREQNEKYGDQAREFIEKKSGKDIPDKVWN